MDLRNYFSLFVKWLWLIVLAVAIAALSSYYFASITPPTYVSSTTMMVGQLLNNPNPSGNDLTTMGQLAQSYALITEQEPVLEATVNALQLPYGWQQLALHVNAVTQGGQLLQVNVTDGNPAQAKRIAEEVAHQLIEQSPTGAVEAKTAEQRRFVSDQMSNLQEQIQNGQNTLKNLTNQAALETDSKKLADLNSRLSAQQTKIDEWQKSYASFGALLNVSYSNFLTIVAPAFLPTVPTSPNIPRSVLIGAAVGLLLALSAIVLFEYLDDTVKDEDEIQRNLGLATLAAVGRIPNTRDPKDALVALRRPRAGISESFRTLMTNLRVAGMETPSGVLLVTSARPLEGKSVIAANLAVAMAQAGKCVVLVETDLRRPSVHKLFDLPNDIGMSDIFSNENLLPEQVMQKTELTGLRVITSGPLPQNPGVLLASKRMYEFILMLRAQNDLVILDTPPTLAVADAHILGVHASGAILVAEAGRTRRDIYRRALASLTQAGIKVYGAVLNKTHARIIERYYYIDNYTSQEKPKRKAN